VSCQLKRRSLKPVVGDTVLWDPEPDGTGTLTEIEPRRSELTRIDSRGRPEIIAANVSQLAIVLAPDPAPDWFLLDRYLAAAELGGFAGLIVFNKTDLAPATPAELGDYAALGYPACRTSAARGDGLAALAAAMRGKRSTLIGQSGVGKSSLLNALVGDAIQSVGELSGKSGQGRHTTTTAVLYALPGGGELIDSPGVRDYAPYIAEPRRVAAGFLESRIAACRFQDCRHLAEPDCAVKAAVAEGLISARRYASYERLYALTESLQSGRY
jgi:ribosome biogenesis GTPase